MHKKNPIVKTPDGEGELNKIFISELGFLMLKVYFPEQKKFINYNAGEYDVDNNLFNYLISG